MKKILPFVALAFLASCSSQPSKTSPDDSLSTDSVKVDTTSAKPAADTSATTAKTAEKWSYKEDVDKMTSKKNYIATIEANELLDFDFPYDGGSTAGIMLRHKDGANDVLLTVTKGQFMTGIDGTTVKVRFDDQKPITFSASSPSDGSSEILFIDSPNKFIKKLKAAKKVLVQAEFYDNGLKTMEFDAAGLKWAH